MCNGDRQPQIKHDSLRILPKSARIRFRGNREYELDGEHDSATCQSPFSQPPLPHTRKLRFSNFWFYIKSPLLAKFTLEKWLSCLPSTCSHSAPKRSLEIARQSTESFAIQSETVISWRFVLMTCSMSPHADHPNVECIPLANDNRPTPLGILSVRDPVTASISITDHAVSSRQLASS